MKGGERTVTKFKKTITSGVALATLVAAGAPSVFAVDKDFVSIQNGVEQNRLNNLKPSALIGGVINIILGIAGIIAFIWLLWGGLQWILSGGDKEGTEKARKRITAALVGLAIVFSAYALIYIVRALFNVDVLGLNLGAFNGL